MLPLLHTIRNKLHAAKAAGNRGANIQRKLGIEILEDRHMLATWLVSNLFDAPVTAFNQAPGTLRQAIYDASHTTGADVIEFSPGLTGTIQLQFADDLSAGASALIISSDITIRGNTSRITIGRNEAIEMRLFYITSSGSLTAQYISMTNGLVKGSDGLFPGDNGEGASGGAIYNQGSVHLASCTLYGNEAIGGNGLGSGYGGTARGGAICNDGGTVTVTNSTFSSNSLQSGTGVSGQLSSFGGGIFSRNGSLAVHNCTITNTVNSTTGRGIYILAEQGNASADIRSTIIGQTELDVDNLEFQAVYDMSVNQLNITGGNNLIRTQGGFGSITAWDQDPMLEPLDDNGGPTPTHALGTNSLAINHGDNWQGLSTDQRGVGFARVVGGIADIGAYELQSSSGPELLGDYNLNQTVDAADYVLWRALLGTAAAPYSGADGNGNGSIEAGDHTVWRSQFGATSAAAASTASSAYLPINTTESGTLGEKPVRILAAKNLGNHEYVHDLALLMSLAVGSNASGRSLGAGICQEDLLPSAAEGGALSASPDEVFAAFGDEPLLFS